VLSPASQTTNKSSDLTTRRFVYILLFSLVLQLCLAALPISVNDIVLFRLWTRKLVESGLIEAYWNISLHGSPDSFYFPINYPPIYPYMLYIIGHLLKVIAPAHFYSNYFLEFFIKVPAIVANVITAMVLFCTLRLKDKKIAFIAATAYALNPALIFDTGYWNQIDSLYALFLLCSILCLVHSTPECAGIAITMAALTKLLLLPFVPFIFIVIAICYGWKRTMFSILASACVFVLLLTPFFIYGRFWAFTKLLIDRIDIMPYISVNAHNLWWLIGRAQPWTNVNTPIVGKVTYKLVGYAIFGLFYLFSLKQLKIKDRRSIVVVCASISLGMFILGIYMHENHLFSFFPVFSLFAFESVRTKWIYCILTFTFFFNMFLHDPFLTYSMRIYNIGDPLVLPPEPNLDPDVLKYAESQNDFYTVQQAKGYVSVPWLACTILNSQLNFLIFIYWIWFYYLKKPLIISQPKVATIVVVFVVLTALPIFDRAFNYQKQNSHRNCLSK
jgi:Gpi18-like mannosyltransferase